MSYTLPIASLTLDASGHIVSASVAFEDFVGTTVPPVSAAGHGRIYYDSGTNSFLSSSNGAAYTSLGGSGITQLTGDVTAGPGSGSQAATLPVVNSNVGSFTNANITVDAKGRITAAASGSAGISGSGTANDMVKWTGSTAIGNSLLTDNGSTLQYLGTGGFVTGACQITGLLLISQGAGTTLANSLNSNLVITSGKSFFGFFGGGASCQLGGMSQTPSISPTSVLYIYNATGSNISILHESLGSLAQQRINTPGGATVTWAPQAIKIFIWENAQYDRWLLVG